eukprot:287057_1
MGTCTCIQTKKRQCEQQNSQYISTDEYVMKTQNNWICLRSLKHHDEFLFTNPILLEEELFLVSWNPDYKDILFHKYNISDNKWRQFALNAYHQHLFESNISHICKDKNDFIYCYQPGTAYLTSPNPKHCTLTVSNPKMIIIDAYEKTLKQYNTDIPELGTGSKCIIANDQYHIIGGNDNIHHFIWDQKQKLLVKKYVFSKLESGLSNFGLIYLETQKRLIMFGGIEIGMNSRSNTMWNYSFDSNVWTEMDVKMPVKVDEFGYVITSNERYIILIGGSVSVSVASDAIYVFDIDLMTWHKSKVKPPQYTPFNAIITACDVIYLFQKYGEKMHWKMDAKKIINSYNIDLVKGYIRNYWRMLELNSERCLSNDVIKIIQMYRE